MSKGEKLICITGFGPFVGHEEKNASWEAVKLLRDNVTVSGIPFKIRKTEIPVMYDEVDQVVPKIWKDNPIVSVFFNLM